MAKPRKTTPLQLYRQYTKIESLKRKLREEESKLRDMIARTEFRTVKINVDGVIYEIISSKNSYNSYNNTVYVEALGTAEEFARLSA